MKDKLIVLIIFLYICYVPRSYAQTLPVDATVAYSQARALLTTGTVQGGAGLRTVAKYSANGRVYTKALNIGAASIAAVIRKKAFSPWGLAVTSALVAAQYVLDPVTQSISGASGAQVGELGSCRCEGRTTYANNLTYPVCFGNVNYKQDCDIGQSTMIWVSHLDQQIYSALDSNFPNPAFDSATAPTDQELNDAVLPNLSTRELNDFLNDPETGVPYSEVTEISQAATDLDTELTALNDADPTNDPVNVTQSQSTTEVLIQNSQNTVNNTNNDLPPEKPADFTFSANQGSFDPTMGDVTKQLIPDTLAPLGTVIGGLTDQIGVNITAGGCTIPYSWAMGGEITNNQFSFCEFDTVFTSMGYIIFAFSLLLSGYILIGAKG